MELYVPFALILPGHAWPKMGLYIAAQFNTCASKSLQDGAYPTQTSNGKEDTMMMIHHHHEWGLSLATKIIPLHLGPGRVICPTRNAGTFSAFPVADVALFYVPILARLAREINGRIIYDGLPAGYYLTIRSHGASVGF
jgi:hypothetical protein